jgi:hypothetical protein
MQTVENPSNFRAHQTILNSSSLALHGLINASKPYFPNFFRETALFDFFVVHS